MNSSLESKCAHQAYFSQHQFMQPPSRRFISGDKRLRGQRFGLHNTLQSAFTEAKLHDPAKYPQVPPGPDLLL